VHLGSQGDLDVVLAEAVEWGSHVITVSVSGIPARRTLDAVGALADVSATVAQLLYLAWFITESAASFYLELSLWSVMVVTLIANLGGFAYLLDDESDKNHPFRLWIRPFWRRAMMIILAPFTGDVLPMVGCKTCGLDAPIRSSTRDGVVKWGILTNAFQHGIIGWILFTMHTGSAAVTLSSIPMSCLVATSAAVVLNLPRRISHFVLASCEAAFREKEELADDAKITMATYAKMAHKPSTGSPPRPSSPVNGVSSMSAKPLSVAVVPSPTSGKGSAKPPKVEAKKPVKMSFREQMKSGVKPKSMY